MENVNVMLESVGNDISYKWYNHILYNTSLLARSIIQPPVTTLFPVEKKKQKKKQQKTVQLLRP